MLSQVLHEISNSKEPVTLALLSRKLGIETGALEGMLDYWVSRGRLLSNDSPPDKDETSAESCEPSCNCQAGCPFTTRIPRTYSVPHNPK